MCTYVYIYVFIHSLMYVCMFVLYAFLFLHIYIHVHVHISISYIYRWFSLSGLPRMISISFWSLCWGPLSMETIVCIYETCGLRLCKEYAP